MISLSGALKELDDEAPKQWTRAMLGELHQLRYGKSLTKAARNSDGQYPVYGSNGIVGHHDAYLVEGPVLIVGRKGAVGTVSLCAEPCWPIDTTYFVRPNGHLDIRFSYYLLTFLRLSRLDRSTAIPGLSRDDVHRLRVAIPPRAEQGLIVKRIEALFDEIDQGVESLRAAKRAIGLYRQSLLKSAFEGRLTADWRAENPDKLEGPDALLARIREEREQRYRDALDEWERVIAEWKRGGEKGQKPTKPKVPKVSAATVTNVSEGLGTPRHWLWLPLSTLGRVTGGLTKNQTRGALPIKAKYLRVANVYSNRLVLDEIREIGITKDELRRTRLVKGDLLFVEGNGSIEQIGRVAVWDGSVPDTTHQNHLIRFGTAGLLSSRFALYFMVSPIGRSRITAKASSTSGLHTLSISKVESLLVPVCSHAEQAEVVRRLDVHFEATDLLLAEIDANLARSEALRQSILKRAFSGQLVPQNPTDEPASALLARVRAERARAPAKGRRKTATAVTSV